MDKERNKRLKAYQLLYKRVENLDLGVCAYCGDDRECLDHVPPLKLVDSLDVDKYQKRGGLFVLYPSCLMCNSLLGARKLHTFQDRLEYLYRKYLHLAEVCKWDDDELSKLGRGLQAMILSHETKRKEHNRKLRGVEHNLLKIDENFNC